MPLVIGSGSKPQRRPGAKSPGRPVTVSVHQGTLRWGYHVAATLREVTITRGRRQSTLVGGVESFDRFRSGQKPLMFVALLSGGRAWQWPVRRIEIDSKTVRAQLGPQQQ